MYFASAFLTSQSEIPELDRNSSNESREVRLSVTWKVIRQDSERLVMICLHPLRKLLLSCARGSVRENSDLNDYSIVRTTR